MDSEANASAVASACLRPSADRGDGDGHACQEVGRELERLGCCDKDYRRHDLRSYIHRDGEGKDGQAHLCGSFCFFFPPAFTVGRGVRRSSLLVPHLASRSPVSASLLTNRRSRMRMVLWRSDLEGSFMISPSQLASRGGPTVTSVTGPIFSVIVLLRR